MNLAYVALAWTLVSIPTALIIGARLRRLRIEADAEHVHRWLEFTRRPHTIHEVACELDMTTVDVDDALVWLWKARRVDVARRRLPGGDTVAEYEAVTRAGVDA